MLYHKTKLELLHSLSLQYQYYLSCQDQPPVHTVHRSVLLRPVHKEHRPVPALRMNPLTTVTFTGDGASGPATQSAPSHDSGRTVLYPDLYVLTSVEHWTKTTEAHNYAAAAGSFCFVTTENREQQYVHNLTTFLGVQRSLSAAQVLHSQTELTVKPETFWNAVCHICGQEPQEGEPEGNLVCPGSTSTQQALC